MSAIATPRRHRSDLMRRLGVDTRYLLLGFPVGVASFVALVTGLALGVGLLITVLGLPILAGTLRLAGPFAALERTQVAQVLGRPTPAAGYRTPPAASSTIRRLRTVLTDARRWRETVHGLARFPVVTFTWSLTITWWAVAVTGLSYPLWSWVARPQGPHTTGLGELLGLSGRAWDLGLTFALGLLAALALPSMMHGLAAAQANLGRGLLSSPASAVRAAPLQAPSSSWS